MTIGVSKGGRGRMPPSWNLSLAPSALALIVPKSLKRPKIAKFSIVCRRREKLTISSSPCVQRPLFCLKSRNFARIVVFSLSCKQKVVFGWKSWPSLENSLVPRMHTTQHGSTCRQTSRRNHSQSVWALSSTETLYSISGKWKVYFRVLTSCELTTVALACRLQTVKGFYMVVHLNIKFAFFHQTNQSRRGVTIAHVTHNECAINEYANASH